MHGLRLVRAGVEESQLLVLILITYQAFLQAFMSDVEDYAIRISIGPLSSLFAISLASILWFNCRYIANMFI